MGLDFFMWAFGVVVAIVVPVVGGVLKMIFSKLQKHDERFERKAEKLEALDSRIEAHRLYAAETFATKNDVKDGFDRVLSKLDNLDHKLDRKADK